MEDFSNKIISILENRYNPEPLPVPDQVKEIKKILGTFKLNMYNWRMDKIRKISVMKASMKIPKMEIFAIEMYPQKEYDLPLLAIDFSKMKEKTFVYINFIPVIRDVAYIEKYIFPMRAIHEKYNIGIQQKVKEWMHPYLTDFTVYAMLENSKLENAINCSLDYFDLYLKILDSAEEITENSYRDRFEKASLFYCNELSEKDGSRKMLGRIIGMEKANIIFDEVIR